MYRIWMNLWRFQASSDKCSIENIFTLPYKEIYWQNCSCVVLVPLPIWLFCTKSAHCVSMTSTAASVLFPMRRHSFGAKFFEPSYSYITSIVITCGGGQVLINNDILEYLWYNWLMSHCHLSQMNFVYPTAFDHN